MSHYFVAQQNINCMKQNLFYIFFILILLLFSCKGDYHSNYLFEVSISDSIIFKPLNEYINKYLQEDTNFEKHCVFTICVERDIYKTRYFLSWSTLDYVFNLPLDYYTYYNDNLILIYLSQDIPLREDIKAPFDKPLFNSNNLAWKELYNREKERFSNTEMIFTNPDAIIVTKCTFCDSVFVEHVNSTLFYINKEEFEGKSLCVHKKFENLIEKRLYFN